MNLDQSAEQPNEELSLEDEIAALIDQPEGADEGDVAEQEGAGADQSSEDARQESDPAEAEQEGAAEEPDEVLAPEHWSAEEKERFQAIPAEHRAMVLDARKSLERGYQTKFNDIAAIQKEHEQIVDLIRPVEAQLNAAGMDRVSGIRTLIGAQQMLQQNPVAGLTNLIQQYGGANTAAILQQLSNAFGVTVQSPETEADEYVDPSVKALRTEIEQMKAAQFQQQQYTQQQNQLDAQTQIQIFSETKDADGNLKYPHFEDVKSEMGVLLSAQLATSMEDAYERAVRQNPETHTKWLEERDRAQSAQMDAERKKTVKKAKASSRDVTSKRAAPETPAKAPDNIKDAVEAAYNSVVG